MLNDAIQRWAGPRWGRRIVAIAGKFVAAVLVTCFTSPDVSAIKVSMREVNTDSRHTKKHSMPRKAAAEIQTTRFIHTSMAGVHTADDDTQVHGRPQAGVPFWARWCSRCFV